MIPLKTFQNLTKVKQDRIVQVAVEEFSEKGYAGASINSLVDRLGIAKGSIFQYFGDKKGLFLFVFNKSIDMIKDDLREIRDRPTNEDFFTRLEKIFQAGVIFLKEHPLIYKLYLKALFESEIPFRNDILLSLRKNSLDYISSLLETAKEKGEIRNDIDIAKASFVVDAIIDRFLQSQTVLHLDAGLGLFKCREEDIKAWIEGLVDIIRFGIGRG
ncbi:MAG: TetR/AcrR family transcriptional regulator [Proteobacteria bacterium]|nr:TetR/AcrR family transcriptional regulator [Pseudomonadota bacterium]MBU4067055.1 TetR/AcrR family transcriptional regulator [Pseudomonadota bacterium]MBU4101610.1 TetR/AcrR family transcriptional regulator [Pseudomonadota bacterium]MBU4126272.1 TetR/AcrR family transcriptional regulator [Pseudomonadota bacterium]